MLSPNSYKAVIVLYRSCDSGWHWTLPKIRSLRQKPKCLFPCSPVSAGRPVPLLPSQQPYKMTSRPLWTLLVSEELRLRLEHCVDCPVTAALFLPRSETQKAWENASMSLVLMAWDHTERLFYIYFYVCSHACLPMHSILSSRVEIRGQFPGVALLLPPWRSQGIEYRLPGLVASAFTHRTILPGSMLTFDQHPWLCG